MICYDSEKVSEPNSVLVQKVAILSASSSTYSEVILYANKDYKDEKVLTCQYRRHHPLFYIRPLKEEVVYVRPRIAVYHDVLSETDIATIRGLATPRVCSQVCLILNQNDEIGVSSEFPACLYSVR